MHQLLSSHYLFAAKGGAGLAEICDSCCQQSAHICARVVPIFAGLSCQDLQSINSLIIKREYSKEQPLVLKGDFTQDLYIVRHGRVKLYDLTADGRQKIIRILSVGDFFGELALFHGGEKAPLFAQALEDTGICLIPRREFADLLRRTPDIALSLMQSLAERLTEAESQISGLTLQTIDQRLASWLLSIAKPASSQTIHSTLLTLPMPKRDLASMLGTTPETLSRKLSELQAKHILVSEGQRKIRILDWNRLTELTIE